MSDIFPFSEKHNCKQKSVHSLQIALLMRLWTNNELYIPYARHYKPRLIYFLPHFQRLFLWLKWVYLINYRFLTTETNLKALYIFRCLFTTSSVKLFVVNAIYWFLFTIVFLGKRKENIHQTFHILKMKAHFEKEPCPSYS